MYPTFDVPNVEVPLITELATEFFHFRICSNYGSRHVVVTPISNQYSIIKLASYLEDKGFQPMFIDTNTLQINLNPNIEETLKSFAIPEVVTPIKRKHSCCEKTLLILFVLVAIGIVVVGTLYAKEMLD